MTEYQKAKLDKLFQEKVLEKVNRKSILGGEAVVVHHFIGRRNMATRWYTPNGVPLSHEQHMYAHAHPAAFREQLVGRKGQVWYNDIIKQSNRIAKYINYQDVIDHLNGKKKHYL